MCAGPQAGIPGSAQVVYFRAVRDFIRITLIAALLVPAAACTGPTGLKGSKQLNELDAGEREEACENIGDYFDKEVGEERMKKLACVFSAATTVAFGGGGVPECEIAYDSCLMEPLTQTDDGCGVSDETSCTATVEEYEACLEEQAEGFVTLIDGLSCAAVLEGGASPIPEAGPECTALASKCPGFFSAGGEGT